MIDPAITEPEDAQIRDLVSQATPERYWEGVFKSPGYFPDCYNSLYGNRRLYETEDGTLSISGFHSGVDLCGGAGLPIFAPAPGVIVFAGPLDVRGNATIIDHGWGVYSGFWHQSEILVQVGQKVETGDIIGRVGGTGRVTGPHLHWEIWVNGVQVNPLEWLQESFP
jgi:murein DD-endopeptidase MepM/ murein hydrolase activator NlpD